MLYLASLGHGCPARIMINCCLMGTVDSQEAPYGSRFALHMAPREGCHWIDSKAKAIRNTIRLYKSKGSLCTVTGLRWMQVASKNETHCPQSHMGIQIHHCRNCHHLNTMRTDRDVVLHVHIILLEVWRVEYRAERQDP